MKMKEIESRSRRGGGGTPLGLPLGSIYAKCGNYIHNADEWIPQYKRFLGLFIGELVSMRVPPIIWQNICRKRDENVNNGSGGNS